MDAPEVDETTEEVEEVAEEEQTLASVATDKGDLLFEGELAEGTEVFVADEEGNRTPAEDGDYILEDGRTLKVAEGKVAEIVEAETPTEEETPAEPEEVAALKAENDALKAELESLKSQVEQLKAQPLAKPAHEEVRTSETHQATGDKGLDRLARIASR